MLLQFVVNAQVAKARSASVHARFGKSLGREITVRFEPVKHGLDPDQRAGRRNRSVDEWRARVAIICTAVTA